MQHLQEIERDKSSMQTITQLTSVFEGLASIRIAQIKNQVLRAQGFFDDLWQIYRQLRIDDGFNYGRDLGKAQHADRDLFIAITAEGSFSGDIDQRLISAMLSQYKKDKHDIIVIGHHGAVQLTQHGVPFKKYFKLPKSDTNINTVPLIQEIQQYRHCFVFYQVYESLASQRVKSINLSSAVEARGQNVDKSRDIITEDNYIFEPNSYAVASHLERSMLINMLAQVIFESKLAQYASRYQAMSAAHQKASDTVEELQWTYNRAKRGIKDERLKEIINGMRKAAR